MNNDSKSLAWIFRRLLVITTGFMLIAYTDVLQSFLHVAKDSSWWFVSWFLFVIGIIIGRIAFIGFGSKE